MFESLGEGERGMIDDSIQQEVTFLPARHTIKTPSHIEGSDVSGEMYRGITPEGEEAVRERTRTEVMEVIENSAKGSVIIFGGATDLVRTTSSSQVSGNELKKILADRPGEFLVLDEADIAKLNSDNPEKRTIPALQQKIAENPDKKVVIVNPLYISELSMIKKEKGRFKGEEKWKLSGGKVQNQENAPEGKPSEVIEGEWSEFTNEASRQAGGDLYEAMVLWVKNNGVLKKEDGTEIQGPLPVDIAKQHLKALVRLENFSKKLFPGRPLVIQATGHSWNIDVLVDYLAHNSTITEEGLRQVAQGEGEKGSTIGNFEFPVIKEDANGATITYRGKTYPITAKEFTERNK